MHKFLRAAGFSMYTKKKDIEKLLDLLERQPSMTRCVQVDEESNVCEMRTEVAPGLGISIIGELNEEGNFEREFYFPYQESHIIGSTEECSVQRHTSRILWNSEKECWIKSIIPRSVPSAFPGCPSVERSFFRSRRARNRSKRQRLLRKTATV